LPLQGQKEWATSRTERESSEKVLCYHLHPYPVCRRSTRKDSGDSEILREQVELLGEALAKVVVELEIIKGDMPLSGPQALLFADDALQLIRELKVRDHYPSQDLNAFSRPFRNISLVNTGTKR
jgi:hypothetical protein